MFECKVCGKEFKSSQSLGGHASSHNRGDSFKIGRKKEKLKKEYSCKYCKTVFENGLKLGGHQTHCKLNPSYTEIKKKISIANKGRLHSDDVKKKLSLSRIKYLAENPENHPWKKNSKFRSEPCEKFKSILKDNGFIFEEEFSPIPNRFFAVDIAFPSSKVCIEINGEQHYNRDGTLRKYYKERHELIKNQGWKIIEIHYLKVYDFEYINNIIKMLP